MKVHQQPAAPSKLVTFAMNRSQARGMTSLIIKFGLVEARER